ncbi:MAG: FAD-binding oxidoreductase [Cellvibrionaceae bacterium]
MPATLHLSSARLSLHKFTIAKPVLIGCLLIGSLCSPKGLAEQSLPALKAFSSDGCSLFPDGTWQDNTLWKDCCFKHDYDYWKGGTEHERKASDQALRQCVIDLGETEIAELMLTGVRTGGGPYWPTPYRWGYGWPLGRGYKALSASELAQVEKLSKTIAELHSETDEK